ncbi:MAG: hypothetical protein ACU0DK_09900 [Pseudooceanicola sp.]
MIHHRTAALAAFAGLAATPAAAHEGAHLYPHGAEPLVVLLGVGVILAAIALRLLR